MMYDLRAATEMVIMGGVGSGAHRTANTGDVEDMLALDIRALKRLGLIRLGECVIDMICWSIGGPSALRARLRIDLSDIDRGGTLRIAAEHPNGTTTQNIMIDAVPSSLGGHRCYFICPVTNSRCEILYLCGERFASRAAHRLSYAVQNMTDLSRARQKAARLRRRLRGDGMLARPRGRRRIEIATRLEGAKRKARGIYLQRLAAHLDRSGSQRMPSPRAR